MMNNALTEIKRIVFFLLLITFYFTSEVGMYVGIARGYVTLSIV